MSGNHKFPKVGAVRSAAIMPSYHHSPLPEGSVRLFRLLPHPDEHSRIECRLFTCPLLISEATHHHFDALSYTWGSVHDLRPIWIDDREFCVTENLHAALSHLRDGFIERVVWVDAICINQKDETEKGHQVQSMAKIYAKASRVIVWLGAATATSDQALEDIRRRSKQQFTAVDNTNTQPILELLRRPWFERIWVRGQLRSALSA